jgi:hypothetical protein
MNNLARGRPRRVAIHDRLASEVEELRTRLGGLPSPADAEAIWTDIWYHEAHNSTALEGNTLVLKQVEVLLRDGRATGRKELREYLEVKGYADAARWVYGEAMHPHFGGGQLVTLQEVRHVHHMAMSAAWDASPHPDAQDDENPGNWRRHDIRTFSGGMTPPPHPQIPALIGDWVEDVCATRSDGEPIAQVIARQHAAFERIHPFLDGNGRAGRLLVNLSLVRLGYPPAMIDKRQRARYLDALSSADRGDPGPLGEIIARSVLASLARFVLPSVAGADGLVPLESLADEKLSFVALRAAASRGRLRAVRDAGGVWRSNRRWVDEYRADRYSALRRPRS